MKYVITIGRQFGSGGRELAKMLAERFSIAYYDKQLLAEAARHAGVDEGFFERSDECFPKFPGTGMSFNMGLSSLPWYTPSSISDEAIYRDMSDVIKEIADRGPCVIVGRSADYVLRNHKHVTNVFITADMDQRIQRVCQRRQTDRAHARKFIAEEEAHRAAYYNYYTGKKWGHSETYDVCINSSLMGIEETAKVIAHIICRRYGWDEHRIGV